MSCVIVKRSICVNVRLSNEKKKISFITQCDRSRIPVQYFWKHALNIYYLNEKLVQKRKQFLLENLLNELQFKCKDDYWNSSASSDVKNFSFLFLIAVTYLKYNNKQNIHTLNIYTQNINIHSQ